MKQLRIEKRFNFGRIRYFVQEYRLTTKSSGWGNLFGPKIWQENDWVDIGRSYFGRGMYSSGVNFATLTEAEDFSSDYVDLPKIYAVSK